MITNPVLAINNYRAFGAAVILNACNEYCLQLNELKRYEKGGKKMIELCECLIDTSPLLSKRKSTVAYRRIERKLCDWKQLIAEVMESEKFFECDGFDAWCHDKWDGKELESRIKMLVDSGQRSFLTGRPKC